MNCLAKIKVAIVGAGVGGSSVYRVLREIENVQIVGVADRNLAAPGITLARKDKVYVTGNYEELVVKPEIDVIIEATADSEVQRNIHKLKHIGAAVMEALAGNLLMVILQAKEELLEVKKLKSELWAILNSMQEAIEVANNKGLIKYVNPSFTRVTGIPEAQRVGKNIFEVSPHGALAQSLVKQKAVVGYRSKVGGSGTEVIANAAPILVEGEMEGAVVVFQPITDILKLMDELQKSTTIIENLYAKIDQITGSKYTFDDLTGTSKVFMSTVEIAKRAAKSDFPVLIAGESGTGKELYAHAIHQASQRRGKPFIKIGSASVPDELLESELFGHEKGSFTGAVKTKLGKVELSNGGTLFLDEIGEMNPYLQAKLVRLLREREFERVGGTEILRADVRLITATSMDLKSLVRRGRFREELYFLLNMIEVNLPPLRQRREDVPVLVDHFISKLNRKLGKMVRWVAPDALQLLSSYDWPGNVRELENVIERAMVTVGGDVIVQQHLAPYIGQFNSITTAQSTEIMPLDKMEQMMLKAALARYGETLEGKKKAANALNISLATLYNKLKKYKD
ncbi:MAG: sigma 54-interacting transcriptional regulator [Dethiobacter sp.]|jgi:PAS domain S-box-containing protein|nr:sigma 54-interacting transcriptional regulator [Dethiobacter sp.]MBS3982494.1 sigma 54-interacting transcriptional regulator [Dethiobacter sp.]MCL5992772.1 sigma 54-interacting transcriptional regulator [Bacillota bacterium]